MLRRRRLRAREGHPDRQREKRTDRDRRGDESGTSRGRVGGGVSPHAEQERSIDVIRVRVSRARGGNSTDGDCLAGFSIVIREGWLHQSVHPLIRRWGHANRFGEDQGQDLMTGSDFREMNVRAQASRLHVPDLAGIEIIAQVLGNSVWIGDVIVGAVGYRHVKATTASDLLDSLDEKSRVLALGDLSTELACLVRFQRIVDVGEQGAQRETNHRDALRGLPPSLVGLKDRFRASFFAPSDLAIRVSSTRHGDSTRALHCPSKPVQDDLRCFASERLQRVLADTGAPCARGI